MTISDKLIDIFIRTLGPIPLCNVEGLAYSENPTDSNQPAQLHKIPTPCFQQAAGSRQKSLTPSLYTDCTTAFLTNELNREIV